MCDLLQPHDNSLYIQYLLRSDDAARATSALDQITVAIEKVDNEAHCPNYPAILTKNRKLIVCGVFSLGIFVVRSVLELSSQSLQTDSRRS